MNQTQSDNHQKPTVRRPVLLGLFTGTAVGLGFLLSGVPNVELITLVVALSGAVMGPLAGLTCGVVAESLYSLGSPYGLPVPILLIGQVLGMGLAGLIGALIRRPVLLNVSAGRRRWALLWAAAGGLLATGLFDILTNAAGIVAFDLEPRVAIVGAVSFMLIHLGVNSLLFAVVFPIVLPRLANLAQPALVGRLKNNCAVILLVLLAFGVTSPVEAQDEAQPDPDRPNGWHRPLWNPFSRHVISWLDYKSTWQPIVDGGLGAPAILLGEATTSPSPLFIVDGIPQGTGHKLVDDPWLIRQVGRTYTRVDMGADGWGGTDGTIELALDDESPETARSNYHGIKGKHESYMRGFSLLTPTAPWRLGFDFEESLDNEGYPLTDSAFSLAGPAKIRMGQGRLVRQLDANTDLTVIYGSKRKTKEILPSWGAKQQEIWDKSVSVAARGWTGAWMWRTSVYWTDRDLEWGTPSTGSTDPGHLRKLETFREGVLVDLAHAPAFYPAVSDTGGVVPPAVPEPTGWGLKLGLNNWRLSDTGLRTPWSDDDDFASDAKGQDATVTGYGQWIKGSIKAKLAVSGHWKDQLGWAPAVALDLMASADDPWWSLSMYAGGRAPRSDELFTPVVQVVAERELRLAPNAHLEREKTQRVGLNVHRTWLGTVFAVDLAARRLTNGITWREDSAIENTGMWANDLNMNSARMTASATHQGRFLGWGRARLEGTWQTSNEKQGRTAILPPERAVRAILMWENHFFKEDGILQMAFLSTWRSEMADPWDVSRLTILPSRAQQDLLVGFRLVGVHISAAIRNLTGQRTRTSAATLSPGQEIDWRLNWTFHY